MKPDKDKDSFSLTLEKPNDLYQNTDMPDDNHSSGPGIRGRDSGGGTTG